MEVKRIERGWAGHFILSENCLFRRNTLLEYGDKRWIISTIGELLAKDPKTNKFKIDMIGGDRYYETKAWEAKKEGPYWEINPEKPVSFKSDWYLSECGTIGIDNTANDMHENVVKELTLKIKGEPEMPPINYQMCDHCGKPLVKQDDCYMTTMNITNETSGEGLNGRVNLCSHCREELKDIVYFFCNKNKEK